LSRLDVQKTGGLFDYSIVVVDNDSANSARWTVERLAKQAQTSIKYYSEPQQNIALARNKAIEVSIGDFIAFIDDDEFPDSLWLLKLFLTARQSKTDGILGPVIPYFEVKPPTWALRGRLFDRPVHKTGQVLEWKNTRTGNVLLRRALFEADPVWFLPEFGSGGEDRDFFKRKIGQGHIFIWCNEAPVYETVPPERWKLKTLLRRALLRGKVAFYASKSGPKSIYASLAALFTYALSLPYLLLLSPLIGFETFVKYLVKSCDHLGKIIILFHIDLVTEKYVTTQSDEAGLMAKFG